MCKAWCTACCSLSAPCCSTTKKQPQGSITISCKHPDLLLLVLTQSMACRDLPYAVFGHSMGAWIAFEMAQVIGEGWQSHRHNGVCILSHCML